MSGILRDEWLKALGHAAQPCDPAAMTVMEIAKEFGIGRHKAYLQARRLVEEGRAVATFKMVTTASGIAKRQPAYRLVTETKATSRRGTRT